MNKKIARIAAQRRFFKFRVILKRGRLIPYYWDPRAALSDPYMLRVVVEEFIKIIKDIKPKIEIVTGIATGGISLAAAIALKLNLPWVYLRLKPKGYATNLSIEGVYKKRGRTILVDDVIATGEAIRATIKKSKNELNIKDCIVILDDSSGRYKKWFKINKIKFYSMFTKSELFDYFYKIGLFDKEAYEIEKIYEKDLYNWQKNKKIWQKFLLWEKKFKKIKNL